MQDQILKFLPHREPFLFIEDIKHYDFEGLSIICTKKLKKEDLIFAGHFPNNPIFPGVLSTETIAQAGILLFCKAFEDNHSDFTSVREKDKNGLDAMFYLAGVEKARYINMIVPDCDIEISVKIVSIKLLKEMYVVKLEGFIECDGKKMAESVLTCVVR